MNKQELIELIVVRSGATDPSLRQTLSEYTVEELERYIRLEVADEMLLRANAERAADLTLHKYRQWKADEPRRLAEEKASLEKDRKTFEAAAPKLAFEFGMGSSKSFGLTDANFNIIRTTLGPGFTEYAIQQAIESNAISLTSATLEERTEWVREGIEKENLRRLSMDTLSLRELARQEREQAVAAPPSLPELTETQKMRIVERQEIHQYPLLPEEWKVGEEFKTLDAEFIKNAPPSILRSLIKSFGSDQLDRALIERRPGLHW